jgi:Pyridoxamine 5'-phosphate oxidase
MLYLSSMLILSQGMETSPIKRSKNGEVDSYMNKESLEALLAKPIEAILSVNRPGKGSHLSPVGFIWDGTSFLMITQRTTVKHSLMLRDPHVSLMINDPSAHAYVLAHGVVEMVPGESRPEVIRAALERYIPEEQQEQLELALSSSFTPDQISIIVLHPEKVTGIGLPG